MRFLPPRFSTLRLWTLLASVLTLLLLTFGSVSVDVYRPIVVTPSNMTEIPTEEQAHQTVAPKATTSARLELARRRLAAGSAVFVVAAARPATESSRRSHSLAPVSRAFAPPRPPGSAPVPLRC